jgi:hypothetical protein
LRLQVLCERCSGLCNGAMIPAVEDFTQKQQLLLESNRLQQLQDAAAAQLAGGGGGPAAADGGDGMAEAAGGRQQLLGKLLVSPEELREKLMVRVGGF